MVIYWYQPTETFSNAYSQVVWLFNLISFVRMNLSNWERNAKELLDSVAFSSIQLDYMFFSLSQTLFRLCMCSFELPIFFSSIPCLIRTLMKLALDGLWLYKCPWPISNDFAFFAMTNLFLRAVFFLWKIVFFHRFTSVRFCTLKIFYLYFKISTQLQSTNRTNNFSGS